MSVAGGASATSLLGAFAWPLAGERTRLRPFGIADLDEDYVGWLNDPDVVRYSNQRFRRHDRESCAAYLRSFDGSPNLFLSIRDSADDRAVGTMTAYFAVPHGTVDVGIMVGRRLARGRGLGCDAWLTLVTALLTVPGVRKVTAGTLACNAPMLKLVAAAGMHLEGARRAQEIVDGRPEDVLYFARFRDA